MNSIEIEEFNRKTPPTPIDHNTTSITFERINKFVQQREIYKGFVPERGWVQWYREEVFAYARQKGMKAIEQFDAFYNQSIWLHY